MKKGNVLVLEGYKSGKQDWGVSFTDHNPELKDYVKCSTKEDAFNLKLIIKGIYNLKKFKHQ